MNSWSIPSDPLSYPFLIKEIALTALEITEIIYTEIDCSLIPAATRNVFAHLIDLHERGLVEFQGVISEKSKAIVLSK